jgi:biopolymer transport protein ExbD
MRSRWRKNNRNDPVELNITAFMNLMVILVPFLLITAVFSRMVILELSLPSSNDQSDEVPDTPQLEVIVRDDRFEIGERTAGLMTAIKKVDGNYDLAGLTEYLKRVKATFPDKLDVTILLEPEISYDVVVQVMDAVRVYEGDVSGKRIQAELFPEISIGDAPAAGKES